MAWALAVAVLALLPGWGDNQGDVILYAYYAEQAWHGRHFFTAMPIEYPPINALFFMVPQMVVVGIPGAAYYPVFAGLTALVDIWQKMTLWRLARGSRQALTLTLLMGVCTAILFYTYLKRFDVLAAALTTWMLVRLSQRADDRWAWGAWALGVSCKLYPLVLAPLCLLYSARRGVPPRRLMQQVGVGLGVWVGVHALATWYGGAGAWAWVTYMQTRGLHLASVYTAVALAWQGLGTPVPMQFAFGCVQVATPWSAWCVAASPVLTVACLAITWWRMHPWQHSSAGLWRGAAACVAALLLTSKVLSPQYILWLVPLLGMAATVARCDKLLIVLTLGLCATTAGLFPNELQIGEGSVLRQSILLLRSGLLLGTWAWLCGSRPPRAQATSLSTNAVSVN